MSNAQKYNEVLGFVGDDSVKHTDKFNETKRRLFGNGFEFSDDEFVKLYKLVNTRTIVTYSGTRVHD